MSLKISYRRQALRQRRRQDQRLRPRPALWRRRVRRHAQLRRQGLSPRAAPRPAVGLGQGHLAGNPHEPGGDGQGGQRHAGRQRHQRRLHPPGRHARRRRAGPRPQSHQQSAGDHHHRPHQLYPEEFYENGLEIVTASTIRNHPAALSPRIKSLNYLNNILAKIEGLQAGCVEALMLNHKGEVAECTGDNIFLVRNGDCADAADRRRHSRRHHARRGDRAGPQGRATKSARSPLTRHDVYIADECFLTGSAAEVIPVVKVDHRKIGSGSPVRSPRISSSDSGA